MYAQMYVYIYMWVLRGFLYPYFGIYACTIYRYLEIVCRIGCELDPGACYRRLWAAYEFVRLQVAAYSKRIQQLGQHAGGGAGRWLEDFLSKPC